MNYTNQIGKSIARFFLLLTWFLIAVGLYFCYLQIRESKLLREYTRQIDSVEKLQDNAFSLQLCSMIQKEINVDENTWKHINPSEQPLLGYSATDILSWKEGHCGKGTRLIVLMMLQENLDASRITLYSDDFQEINSHTLISVLINKKEYLVNSINASQRVEDVFSGGMLLFDSEDNKRSALKKLGFQNYSYESIPLVKFHRWIPGQKVITNHYRPGRFISWLSESLYIQKAIMCFGIAIITFVTYKISYSQNSKFKL